MNKVSTIDFYCLTLVAAKYRQTYGKKLSNSPTFSNVDEINSWLHDLKIWECYRHLQEVTRSCYLSFTSRQS